MHNSLKASISAASQNNPGILLYHKFHHRFHKSLLPVRVLSQINPVPVLVLKIHINIILPS